jgi:dihydroorotase-like cyclic amidohydrolase
MINAVNDKLISMNDLSALLSENPAKLYGIYPQKGSLELGTDADITIVDFNENFEIKAELLHSKSKVTAFDGYKILGKPYITIVRGNVVAKDGILCNKLSGKFIKV